MNEAIRLDLVNPVAAAGGSAGVWIADGTSKTVTRFDAATGRPQAVVCLEATPVDVEVAGGSVVVGLTDGSIVWYSERSGEEALRRWVVSGDLALRSAGNRVWVLDREAPALVSFDLAGTRSSIEIGGVSTFAAGLEGVYWISDDGMVRFGEGERRCRPAVALPPWATPTGAMVSCANSLWVSVTEGLLMVSLRTLEPGSALPAPEGPVPHLICDQDNRIIGGAKGVFVLDPAVDANVRPFDVALKSELRALVAAGDRIWALESAEPTAHILRIP